VSCSLILFPTTFTSVLTPQVAFEASPLCFSPGSRTAAVENMSFCSHSNLWTHHIDTFVILAIPNIPEFCAFPSPHLSHENFTPSSRWCLSLRSLKLVWSATVVPSHPHWHSHSLCRVLSLSNSEPTSATPCSSARYLSLVKALELYSLTLP